MALKERGNEEGCIAVDRWCAVNFVNAPYLIVV